MNPLALPAPLAEPLHLIQPSPWPARLAVLLGIVLAVLVARWLARQLQRPEAPVVTTAPAPPMTAAADTTSTVDEIRQRFDAHGQYRRGCHALAEAIRQHLAEAGLPSQTWTASDIAERTEDAGLVALSRRLADLRFGRREPVQREFHEVCDRTQSTLDRRLATTRPTAPTGADP